MVSIPRDIIFEIVSYINDLKDIGKCAQINSIFREYVLKKEVINSTICKFVPLETILNFQNLQKSFVPVRVNNFPKLKMLALIPKLTQITISLDRSLDLRLSQLVPIIIGFMEYYLDIDRNQFSITFDFSKLREIRDISSINICNDSLYLTILSNTTNYLSTPDIIDKLIEELYNYVKFKNIHLILLNGEQSVYNNCIKSCCDRLNLGYHKLNGTITQ